MKCPDIAPLVTRFFDGELDGPHMRTVALHITRCPDCEAELRTLEKVQDLVVAQAVADIEGIDTNSIWQAVAAEIEESPQPWTQRLRAWWDDFEILSPVTALPAVAAVAAFLAVNFWQADHIPQAADFARPVESNEITEHIVSVSTAEETLREVFRAPEAFNLGVVDLGDNSAVIDTIVGGVDHLMIEPETRTAVFWIGDGGVSQ